MELRQLLSTGATAAAAVPLETLVSVVAAKGAKEAADPTKGNGGFVIKRTGPKDAPLDVFYALGGTATPDVDYTGPTGMVTIPAGKSFVKVPVHAFQDTDNTEGRETLTITLAAQTAYGLNPSHATATMGIRNTFAIDAATAFGVDPHTYTATMRTNFRDEPEPKSITTADATFPLDLGGFTGGTGASLTMAGTWQPDGLHMDQITLQRQGSWTSRFADLKGTLFIPETVGPSSTRKITAPFAVFGSTDTVSGTLQVTSKAGGQVRVKVPAGTFSATKLVVTTSILAHGRATVQARDINHHEVTRRIPVFINEQVAWTYFLVEGLGVVKAVASGTFKQTTDFAVSFKVTYVMAPPPATSALVLAPDAAALTA